jgi:dihydrofolate synthase/folylpolyglutamate synthase
VILDASHNPEGAETLERNLRQLVFDTGRAPIVLVGVLGEARARPLIEAICRYACEVRFVVPQQLRACSYEALERMVPSSFRGRIVRETVAGAFPRVGECSVGSADEVVVVTGSIYLLGEVMSQLQGVTGAVHPPRG